MTGNLELARVRIIGFRGDADSLQVEAVREELRRQLQKLATPETHLLALTALGGRADLLFARTALELSIPLVIYLGDVREEQRRHLAPDLAEEFDAVLDAATRVEILVPSPDLDTPARLGQKLVDEADVILVLNGAKSSDPAVAEIVTYASHRNRPVIRLVETEGKVEVQSLGNDAVASGFELSLDQIERMLGEAPAPPPLPERLVTYFHTCDDHATRFAPRVRRYALDIVLANAVASVAGGVSSGFTHSAFVGVLLGIVKFGSILIGLAIFAVMRHRQSRTRWLLYRLKAEICRSAIATWESPIRIEALGPDEVPEVRDLLQALRYLRTTHKETTPPTLESFKASYGRRRLIHQYDYFQKQSFAASRLARQMTPLYWVLSGSALVISAFTLVLQWTLGPALTFVPAINFFIVIIPIAAPALASWIVALQAIEAVSRKKARFLEMERLMHQALIDLVHCRSWESVHVVVQRAERQLLGEVLEWQSFVKYS